MARKVTELSVHPGYAFAVVAGAFVLGMMVEDSTGKAAASKRRARGAGSKAKAKVARVQKAVQQKKGEIKQRRKTKKISSLEEQQADIEARLKALRRNRSRAARKGKT